MTRDVGDSGDRRALRAHPSPSPVSPHSTPLSPQVTPLHPRLDPDVTPSHPIFIASAQRSGRGSQPQLVFQLPNYPFTKWRFTLPPTPYVHPFPPKVTQSTQG